MGSEFLSVAEAARLLGVSADLVYDAINRGELPAVQMGKRKLVPRIAIDALTERVMDGFDPDALLARLAAAVPPDTEAGGPSGASGGTGASSTESPPVLSLVAP